MGVKVLVIALLRKSKGKFEVQVVLVMHEHIDPQEWDEKIQVNINCVAPM